MSPGSFNGHNHGGGHTGTGKKQRTGVYNLGYHSNKQPNQVFKVGIEVYNIQTGITGSIIEKALYKNKRSIVLVKMNNKQSYMRTSTLRTLDYHDKQVKMNIKTFFNDKNKKNSNRKNQINESQKKRAEFRDKRKLINSILSEHNNHTIKLDQNGSNDNLCPWVSSRSDYYKFVNENDSHSIKRLFERDKLIKKFIINKITQNYINKIIDKKDKSIDSPGFKEYIDEKRTEYKSELHHKDLKTLKIMSDFKLEDLNTNKEEEDYEIIDNVPLEVDYELC